MGSYHRYVRDYEVGANPRRWHIFIGNISRLDPGLGDPAIPSTVSVYFTVVAAIDGQTKGVPK